MTTCGSLSTHLGGTCSSLGEFSFRLSNQVQGLSFGGLKFGDEYWGPGQNSPRNLCLLAVHGGVMPSGGTLVTPTTQSFAQCCASELSSNGQYWWESCSMGQETSYLCSNTLSQKQCTNFALLQAGDVWANQISTGATCYTPDDADRTPSELSCYYSENPLPPYVKQSSIHFGPADEHELNCKYTIGPDGEFDMANTGCEFEM